MSDLNSTQNSSEVDDSQDSELSPQLQSNKIVQIESSSDKLYGVTVDGIKGPVMFALTGIGVVVPIIIDKATGNLMINPEVSKYGYYN